MPDQKSSQGEQKISRDELANLLNEDLAREYQAIISYVVYSQVLKGAEYMSIADQLELHAPSGAEARPDHFATGRLSGQNAVRHAQARSDFGNGKGNAPLRSGK